MSHPASLPGCFPDTAARRTVTDRFDDGWDCSALVLDGELVVRLPRRPEVVAALTREAEVLDLLAAQAPVVPAPRPLEVCPEHGSMVQPLIRGAPLSGQLLDHIGVRRLVSQIVTALRAVHRVPADALRARGIPDRDLAPTLHDFAQRVLPLVGHPSAADLLDDARRTTTEPFDRALIHADLGPAHLLCDAGGLVGIIDWADACVGDPATDLAWLLNGVDGRLRAALIEALCLDAAIVARADLYHRLGPWWEVTHGLDRDDPHLVESGLQGVRARLPG